MTESDRHRPGLPLRARLGAACAVFLLTASAGACSSGTTSPSPSRPDRTSTGTAGTSAPAPSSAAMVPPTSTTTPLPARAGVTFGSSLYALSRRDLARALDDVVTLRMTWIRIDLSWSGIQPLSSSRFQWGDVDAVVAAARARKLQVLGLLTYTPPWAREAGCARFSCPPRRSSDFARFASAAVGRYAPRGVRTYQVWNEPNITAFWNSPDPARYGALLRLTSTAIRDAARGTRVLFGSLAFTGDDDATRVAGNIDAAPFLRRACAGRDCRVDAVGYDPYTYPRLPSDTGAPLNAWQRIANPAAGATSLRTAMTAVGLGRVTVWVTAFGAPTMYRGATDRRLVTEQRQAGIVADGARLAGTARSVVGAYFVNTLRDDPSAGPVAGRFGLVRADGTRKPAFAALTTALAR